jgi:REP element-mobilizing transposase RayT
MTFNPDQHHRRSMRLKGYDYAQAGAYFITICTDNRACLFGEITDGLMRLNELGRIAEQDWLHLPEHHPHLDLDAFVIMPNHLHGVLIVSDTPNSRSGRVGLAEILRGFKSFSARAINVQRGASGVSVWQRNYYERVIRDEAMLNSIRQYIENNPVNWDKDTDHPTNFARAPRPNLP